LPFLSCSSTIWTSWFSSITL